MKLSRVRIFSVVIIVVIVLGLSAWTLAAPQPLQVQSQSSLGNTVFSYAQTFSSVDFSDGLGSFGFKFGFDFSTNLTVGFHTEFAVYSALVSQNISSPIVRGVALSLQSATLLIDGREDLGVSTLTKSQPRLQAYYLQNPDLNIAPGLHNITARLILSTVDVGYIGSFGGSTRLVTLNGTINLTAT